MHNRLPEGTESREISVRDGLVLAPLVAVIVALAFYPGLILERGQNSVTEKVDAVAKATASPALAERRGWTGYAPVADD
jgi:NADH-quinone oxidoreductase subunit M